MKKSLIATLVVLFLYIGSFIIMAYTYKPQDRTYTIQLTLQQAQVIINALDKSELPSNQISVIKTWISAPIEKQLNDEAKADSVKKGGGK